jgi:hypothetical protein
VPLTDEHGYAEACLAGWDAQTHDRERLQLIVVDPLQEPTAERRLRPLLRSGDVWMQVASPNEAVLFDRGARAALAPAILFTEAHCVPPPETASTVLDHLDAGGCAAVSLKSGYLPTTALGRRQTELEEVWNGALPAGGWRALSLRGFAVRRDTYLDLGGFRAHHERFAETALAASLALGGHRIGRTAEVTILHGNAPTPADLEGALRSCGRGQWRWRDELDVSNPGLADQILGPLPLRRPGRSRAWATRPLGRLALRASAAIRLTAARIAALGLVHAGSIGARAYFYYWREAFRFGFVEAWTETTRDREAAAAPGAFEQRSNRGDDGTIVGSVVGGRRAS